MNKHSQISLRKGRYDYPVHENNC